MDNRALHFGWGAAPLAEQLAGLNLEHLIPDFQKDADAIEWLHIRNILSDGERYRAHRQLAKKINSTLK